MAAIYFTLTGIALHLVADWLLERIEVRRGARHSPPCREGHEGAPYGRASTVSLT